ncbi:MAG: hypothetical protein K2I18_05475 [Paramuribaculum sp.]|nr:hypothetical protein [Paramuribaculum sp.]
MRIPDRYFEKQPDIVVRLFCKWRDYMHSGAVDYSRGDSCVHGMNHYERVLFHVLTVGQDIFGDDEEALEALAQAAVWHDSRRQDEELDTGHGARAAVYYTDYCRAHPDVRFHDEVPYLMRYHDLDDSVGQAAIKKGFGGNAPRVLKMYEVFKDADALDRWRLGSRGLNTKYLRTASARQKVDEARELVNSTEDPCVLKFIDDEVRRNWVTD